MRLTTLHLIFFFLSLHRVYAQPSKSWDKTLGGSGWDEMHVILPAPDGGYYLGGNVHDPGGDVSATTYGQYDFWLVKMGAGGQKIWDHCYGGSADEKLNTMLFLPDGNLLLGGYSASDSSGNKQSNGYGLADYWLVKVTPTGEYLWEKTIGGTGDDLLFDIQLFPDSTLVLVGTSDSPISGLKTEAHYGGTDAWVLKMDLQGNILTQQCFGGYQFENLYKAVPTADGGFLLGGAVASETGHGISEPSRGRSDFWVVKINEDGFYEWDKRYGGSEEDQIYHILPLKNGDFLLSGASNSPKSGDRTFPLLGVFDGWTVRIKPDGEKIQDQVYGGSSLDVIYKAVETRNGNLFLLSVSDSPANALKKSGTNGSYDFWLVYTDSSGAVLWDKSYGGQDADAPTDMLQLSDFSLILAGHSLSNEGGFKSEHSRGANDFWIMKTQCLSSVALPPDVVVCGNTPLQIQAVGQNCAGGVCEFYWSNGAVGSEISFSAPTDSTLGVFVLDKNGCGAFDTMQIETLAGPSVDLGADTTIFEENDVLSLSAEQLASDNSYHWSTGSSDPTIDVSSTGDFSVTVTNELTGCTASDTIRVCACSKRELYIPNVFQPDLDIYNDVWYVFAKPGAVDIIESIEVVDVWGHKVFEKKQVQPNEKQYGWDGRSLNGRRLGPGVYTYAIRVKYSDGKLETIFGTVTIVW